MGCCLQGDDPINAKVSAAYDCGQHHSMTGKPCQDRAAGFYEKLGYKLNPDADLSVYDHHAPKKDEEPKKPKKNLGFTCVLVEKYV